MFLPDKHPHGFALSLVPRPLSHYANKRAREGEETHVALRSMLVSSFLVFALVKCEGTVEKAHSIHNGDQ